MEIHNCIHCGTEAQPNWRFCRRCGTGLTDLETVPRVAACSNCTASLADGWRFCPNCGTDTDTATPQQGLSNDEVADLIAAPATGAADVVDPAAVVEREPPQAEVAPPEPAVEASPIPAAATEPVITGPEVSFEPADDAFAAPMETVPPPQVPDFPDEPPPPPPDLDPPLTIAEIEARLDADRLPAGDDVLDERPAVDSAAPGDIASPGEDVSIPDSPAAADAVDIEPDAFEVQRESPAAAAGPIPAIDEPPAVIVPPRPERDRPEVLRHVPTPIGRPDEPGDEIVPPEITAPEIAEDEAAAVHIPAREDRAVATPQELPARAIPQPLQKDKPAWSPTQVETEDDERELAPLDREFTDPGLRGQLIQLALLATAAIAVAMMVAHVVLNNRLTDYGTTGESVARIQSVQSIIGTWLRPILIVAVLATFVLLVEWARRVVANIAVFGKVVPEAALWMWAIPGVNLFVMRQHFDDAWKGSDIHLKDDPGWRKTQGNWWSLAFAVFAVLAIVVLFYGNTLGNGGPEASINESLEASIDANTYLLIGYGLIGASLLCAVRSVGAVIERQHNRAQRFA